MSWVRAPLFSLFFLFKKAAAANLRALPPSQRHPHGLNENEASRRCGVPFFCKKPPISNIFPLTNGKSVILYFEVILQNFIPYQEWLRERPDETTATCLCGKVPNPTSLLTSTDEERFYARSVERWSVHLFLTRPCSDFGCCEKYRTQNKRKGAFYYGKKTVYFRIRHRGSSR